MIEELSLALPLSFTAGEEIDIPALVESYSTLLFRIAYSILRNAAEAEDVVQDVFVRVLEHRRKLAQVRDVRVWLARIAWNLALDRRRRIRPEQMDELFAQQLIGRDVPADRQLHDLRQMRLVLAAMDRLPQAERQALLLGTLDELSTAEIARIMGKSESAIRALVFRARERLRSRLEVQQSKGGVR